MENDFTFGKILVDVWYGRMPCADRPFKKCDLNSELDWCKEKKNLVVDADWWCECALLRWKETDYETKQTNPRSDAKYLNLSCFEQPKNFKASSKCWNVSWDDVDFCVDR